MSNRLQSSIDQFWGVVGVDYLPGWVTPNGISMARLALIPLIIYLTATTNFLTALVALVVIALTDSLDGALARRRGQMSAWGRLIDPLADKLLILLPLIVLLRWYPAIGLVIGVVLVDVLIVLVTIGRLIIGGHSVPPARLAGKVKLVLEVLSLIGVYLAVMIGNQMVFDLSYILLVCSIGVGLIALVDYIIFGLKK